VETASQIRLCALDTRCKLFPFLMALSEHFPSSSGIPSSFLTVVISGSVMWVSPKGEGCGDNILVLPSLCALSLPSSVLSMHYVHGGMPPVLPLIPAGADCSASLVSMVDTFIFFKWCFRRALLRSGSPVPPPSVLECRASLCASSAWLHVISWKRSVMGAACRASVCNGFKNKGQHTHSKQTWLFLPCSYLFCLLLRGVL